MTTSDPQRPPGKTPPRAEPLQPDRPGAGDRPWPADDSRTRGRTTRDEEAQRKRRVQEENAVENNREGFGR